MAAQQGRIERSPRVVELARLLTPEEIAADPGDPDAAAPAPGPAPFGEARSLRRAGSAGEEFALIYQVKCAVIVRTGPVGRHGAWEIFAYPTPGAASNGYARRCAKLSGDGFVDVAG